MTTAADPSSRRYVLDDRAPYLCNLASLWSADPALAAQIERIPDDEMYSPVPAKDGSLTLAIPSSNTTGNSASIFLHSRYRPLEEAAKLVDSIHFDEKFILFVHGLGLGHHVQRLLEQSTEESTIICFEPDLRLVKTTLWHQDFSEDLESRRLILIAGGDKSVLFNSLAGKIALLSGGTETVNHAPSLQLHPDFHAETTRWTEEYAAYARASINTLILNGRRTAENISRNIAWYAATPGIDRLKNLYKDKPAIIISAGPSLRKNKHLFKDLESRACLIAVQTTLQPMLELGVEPHFVTSLDFHDISARFFENLPKTLRTELVAEPKAAHIVLGLHPGPVTLTGNDYAERLLKELHPRKGNLRSGATVAHLSYYLAEHLGCNPIIFVGQDLGFSDGLCYAPGTSYEDVWRPELSRFCTVEMKQWEQIVRERHILRRVLDHEGRPTYTEERLFTYLQQFERDFLQTSTTIIDATEGGVFKRGSTPMLLAEAITKFIPVQNSEFKSQNSPPDPDWSQTPACIDCLRKRKEESIQIQDIAEQTLPLLEQIHDNLSDQPKVNQLIAQVDDLRQRMNELADCYELLLQLTQTTELERFHRDRAIAASRAKGTDRQRRQVLRDIENVRAILATSSEFQKLMDRVIEELS